MRFKKGGREKGERQRKISWVTDEIANTPPFQLSLFLLLLPASQCPEVKRAGFCSSADCIDISVPSQPSISFGLVFIG